MAKFTHFKNYILGPGDEIIISLWGESNVINTEIINRDGQVFIDNVGILNIGSKNIFDAKSYLLSKYSKVYSTLWEAILNLLLILHLEN